MYRTSPKIGCSTNLENLRRRAYRPRWLHFQCGWWFSLTMGSYKMVFDIYQQYSSRWETAMTRGEGDTLLRASDFHLLAACRRTVWAMENPSFDRKTFLVVPKSSQVREVSPFTSHLWLLISEIIRTQFRIFKKPVFCRLPINRNGHMWQVVALLVSGSRSPTRRTSIVRNTFRVLYGLWLVKTIKLRVFSMS